MIDDSRPAFSESVRRQASAFLRARTEAIESHWRRRLLSALGEASTDQEQELVELAVGYFGHLCDGIEGQGGPAAADHLRRMASLACEAGVPYVMISRGLRRLKRYLMQAIVTSLEPGRERDQVCDLIEEEIDESRVLVNQYYHTHHEELLRQSETLNRFLLNNVYDAVFVIDCATGDIQMANAAAVRLTGRTQEDLRQTTFLELVPDEQRPGLRQALGELAETPARRFEGLAVLDAAGKRLPTLMQLTMISPEGGTAQVTVRDTSREVEALAAQQQEATYLRQFVTDTADGVMVIDASGRIRTWNKGAEQIFGYRADEILNRPVTLLLPPELRAQGELDKLERAVREKGYLRNYETVRHAKDGRRLDVELTRTSILDPATGQWLGMSAVVRDVTDKKRLEREAAQKTRQLEIVNRILEATSRSLDRDQTFRTIAAQMEGLLPCDAMMVLLPEAEMERLRTRVLLGDHELQVGLETVLSRGDTIGERALADKAALVIDDLTGLPEPRPYDRELAEKGYRSVLITPLVYNHEAMGAIALLHRDRRQYGEQDRAQLDHLAGHFAVILENARRYEEERRRAAQFGLISRVGAEAIASIGDVRRLMRSVVDTIQTDFGYYDVAIYELAEEAEVFRLLAQAGHRRGSLGQGHEQPVDVGIFGQVLATRASYVCNDVLEDPTFFDPAPEGSSVRSELCVPIRLGPKVFGVLDVESQRPNRFDRLDRAAMEALASLLARCAEADESLRQTRMLHAMRQNIMEAVPSALILLNVDLCVQFVNQRYCEFFGQSHEDIMGRHASEVFPRNLIEESRFETLIERLKQDHKPIDQREVRYLDFAGTERYADIRLRIVTEYETTYIVMLHDATNRLTRLYQLSMLQEIGEEMQRTLDTDRLLQAILTCVTAGPGFGFNRAALFLFNSEQTRLEERMRVGPGSIEEAGTIWQQVGHKKSLREFLREYDRAQIGPELVTDTQQSPAQIDLPDDPEQLRRWRTPLMLRADDADGEVPLARALRAYSGASEVLVVPLVSQEALLGLVVADNLYTGEPISRDSIRMLTTFANQAGVALANAQAFEQLEHSLQALREAQDELRLSARLAGIGSVAAHVAHEIRNPLVSIGGFARRLTVKAGEPDYVANRAAIIIKEVERLERVLKNVADFTAPGQPVLAPTRIEQVVHEMLVSQGPMLEESGAEVATELAPDLPELHADAGKLQQVLINLVRNAVQAVGRDGQVRLCVTPADEERIRIEVIDHGPGIPADRLEEIFNPFFTNKADGTGLGLAVCRQIVNDHGGELTVQSVDGEGATFTVMLPLRPETVLAQRGEGETSNDTPDSDRRG